MGGWLLLGSAGRATQDLSIFDPASPPAESIRSLSFLVFAITGGIFLVVEGILFYSIFRFRRRGPDDKKEPPQVYGSKSIEIAWTAAPTLIVFVLVLVTTRTLWEVSPNPPEPAPGDKALYVTVVGRQWWWEYFYDYYDGQKLRSVTAPGEDLPVVTANELHVPAGGPVRLTLKSADVCHSFWVPRLAGKTDLIPGRTNYAWFQTTQKGLLLGQCAEYCGTQHAKMLLRVIVEEPPDFERWLENEKKPAVDDAKVRAGKAAFLSQSCVNCHRVRGTPAKGTYAPDLTHLMTRETLAAGIIRNDAENLRQWVQDPQKIKVGCLMPAFGLGERERDLIVDYLLTLH
jgi:cytochrome c oxidase subunit 2